MAYTTLMIKEFFMTDRSLKIATIRRIENFKLDSHLVVALDDHLTAESVLEALSCLDDFSERWI